MNTQFSILKLPYKHNFIALTLILGCGLMLSTPIFAGAKVAAAKVADNDLLEQSKSQKQYLEEKWGIKLVTMRSTAAGHMIDFRYRVVDAEKAMPLFKRQTKPYLIHQESGKVLAVPNTAKIGSLRNSNTPQNGRIYWMFFGNHQGLVHKGDKVTVAIGDFRAIDISVD